MRNSSRTLACALLASSIAFVGLTGPAAAETTPAPSLLGSLLTPSPSATATPTPTPTQTETATPKPKPKPKPKPTRAQKVIKWAAKQKGDPYKYGANGPKAFDCAGLVQYSYKKAGKKIGRTAGAQLKGKHIKKSKKKKGDILVFLDSSGYAYHSAIYAGDGKMWESQRSGTRVGKHKIWSSGYVVRRP